MAKYRAKNGSLPTSIIVYRDGVGEGQISHVHKTEVRLLQVCYILISCYFIFVYVFSLQTACEQVYGPKSVPFAFVIVTKRISARFFAPTNRGPENPRPGTIIDTVVTDPTK